MNVMFGIIAMLAAWIMACNLVQVDWILALMAVRDSASVHGNWMIQKVFSWM
jgi:hypothetical protein